MASIAEIFRDRLVELTTAVEPERIIHAGGESQESQTAYHDSHFTHVADHFEFVFPIEGTTRIALSERVVELQQGNILLIERGVMHSEIVAEPLNRYEVFWFHVRGSSALLTETTFSPPNRWTPVGPLGISGRVDLESIASAIASEVATRAWGWEGSVRGLIHYLCSIVIRRLDRRVNSTHYPEEPPAVLTDPRTWNIVRSVLEYCEGNYHRGVSLSEVAETLGYSPGYLSRLVTRHIGRSLSNHLQSRRMEAAKHMLEQVEMNVSEISEQLGYSDPAHFSRAFIKATGLSPRAYRKRIAKL